MTLRRFQSLSPFECVLAVADRYDVEVILLPSRGAWSVPRGASQGPAGHYVNARTRRVFLESAVLDFERAASELHEVVHAIVAPPPGYARSVGPEHTGLLQFELALAREVFPHRRDVVDAVRSYQGITFVDDRRRVGDWNRYERTRWWRSGAAWMHALGFLDAGRPTWRRGHWPARELVRAHAHDVAAAVRDTPDPPGLG